VTDYYSALSDSDVREHELWGDFALNEFPYEDQVQPAPVDTAANVLAGPDQRRRATVETEPFMEPCHRFLIAS
jgi:hypothetical protein